MDSVTAKRNKLFTDNKELIDKLISDLWQNVFKKKYLSCRLYEDDFESMAYYEVLRNIDKWNSRRSCLKTFLSIVIKNKATTLILHENAQSRLDYTMSLSLDTVVTSSDNTVYLIDTIGGCYDTVPIVDEEDDLQDVIDGYMRCLTATQKKVFRLFYEGYNKREIAKMLNISVKAVTATRETLQYDRLTKPLLIALRKREELKR